MEVNTLVFRFLKLNALLKAKVVIFAASENTNKEMRLKEIELVNEAILSRSLFGLRYNHRKTGRKVVLI